MIDLDKLKGATLDDNTFAELKAGIDDLVAQRDAARTESIAGRKGKDTKLAEATAKLAEAQAERDEALQWAGVDSLGALRDLPGPKGQADAAKQFDLKLKAVQRALDEKSRAHDELGSRLTGLQRETQIAKALDGHQFKNAGDVRVLIERRVKQEGDELLFETDDGKLVPLKEGAAWFAKTRPDYLLASDAGGQGSGFKGAGKGGSGKTIPQAQFDALRPAERAKVMADGFVPVEA